MKKSILIPVVLALVCIDLMMFTISAGINNMSEQKNNASEPVAEEEELDLTEKFYETKATEAAVQAANQDLMEQLEETTDSKLMTSTANVEYHFGNLLYIEADDAEAKSLEEETEEQVEETENTDTYKYIGKFKFSYYCPCIKCCGKSDGITATGTKATAGRTVAVDPSVIPYGTKLKVVSEDGTVAYYVAEDCGGSIKNNRIDIFVNEHQEALNLGINYGEVYIIEEGEVV